MRIGILRAGAGGSALGRAWGNSGHQVAFATRDPDDPLAIGPSAGAGAVQRVVEHAEVVVLATRPLIGI
jgi:predicted dinucleotide-binding enzyme